MGQRLVVTIHAFGKDIATIYYHWGAYTDCSLEIAKNLTYNFDWHNYASTDELILGLTRFLESNGGGIDHCDQNVAEFKKRFPVQNFRFKGVSRSNGLIAISEATMAEQADDACGEMTISYDSKKITNSCYSWYENTDDCIASNGNNIEFGHLNLDPTCFEFDKIDIVKDSLHSGYDYYVFADGVIGPEDG